MTRCTSTYTVPAVRGQLDKAGKPVMVKLGCNVQGSHSEHANEVVNGKPVRFTWK